MYGDVGDFCCLVLRLFFEMFLRCLSPLNGVMTLAFRASMILHLSFFLMPIDGDNTFILLPF